MIQVGDFVRVEPRRKTAFHLRGVTNDLQTPNPLCRVLEIQEGTYPVAILLILEGPDKDDKAHWYFDTLIVYLFQDVI